MISIHYLISVHYRGIMRWRLLAYMLTYEVRQEWFALRFTTFVPFIRVEPATDEQQT